MSQAVKTGPGSIELGRSASPIVKADKLLFVHFERPDLAKVEEYLCDFGLISIKRTDTDLFLRGTDPQPYIYRATRGPAARFLGLGFSVATGADLEKLAKATGRGPTALSSRPWRWGMERAFSSKVFMGGRSYRPRGCPWVRGRRVSSRSFSAADGGRTR